MIYQHPLAYLIGLEGIALLRAFAGEYDREFTLARFREIRALLDAADELGDGVEETPMTMREGYAQWAPWYDEPGNELLEVEEPVVREILDALPVGVALDAGCGTGRHGAYLASLGHKVIGVDTTPEMLEVARAKIPAGDFYEADLRDLPVTDDSVDVVVCAIAVSHVPDLEPVFAEFARVLRPGGHLVLTDSRGLIGDIGSRSRGRARTGRSATSPCGAASRATTSPLRSPTVSRFAAARSYGGRRLSSTTRAGISTIRTRRSTGREDRRSAGRSTASRPRRRTPPTAASHR